MGTIIVVSIVVFVLIIFVVTHHTPSSRLDIGSQPPRPFIEPQRPLDTQSATQPTPARYAPEAYQGRARSAAPASLDLSLIPRQFVVLDLETTGLSPSTDEIIEIGAIRVNRDSGTHPSFQCLVKPSERVPRKITEITGITQAMVDRDGLPLFDVLAQFKEFIGDLPIVTFNAAFDMGFIWKAAKKHGIAFNNRYTCALKMARRAYPDLPSHRLVDLAKMGNVSDENAHRALGDCKRTVPVFMSSVMKIGERVMWEVPPVDWRVSVQYNAEREANRAFVAETRALETIEPELAITRYRQAMARMYEYEKLIYSWHGDDHILDRMTLVLGKLGRYEELIECVDEFVARFPETQSSIMTGILNRQQKAKTKLESASTLAVQ